MALFPTSPDGCLYAALIRRIEANVAALKGKVWTIQAPAGKAPPFAVLRPLSGEPEQSFDGRDTLRRKTMQVMVKGPEADGLEGVCSHRDLIEAQLIGCAWGDVLGAKTVAVDKVLAAGDGFEDYDAQAREYVAWLRCEIFYRVTATPA